MDGLLVPEKLACGGREDRGARRHVRNGPPERRGARGVCEHTFKRNDRITERQQCLASYLGTAEGLHAAEGLGTAEGPGM